MTEKQIMKWYKDNLFSIVVKAIEEKKKTNPSLIYTPDWLIAIAYRETWTLVLQQLKINPAAGANNVNVKGDYSQRPGETEKKYHGYGFWQIDIGSFPDFIKSGDWKDPYKCCLMAIDVLEQKRKSLVKNYIISNNDKLHRAITAAHNCGEGNVLKALRAVEDIDSRTHGKDYSKMVWQYRQLYNSLQ